MKYLKEYNNFLNESTDNNDVVDKIVDTMLDFIDEGEKITFKSSTGDMTYSDYLEKNIRYQNFKPVLVSKNKTVSKFSIVYSPKDGSYNNLMVVLDNMQSTIGRLGEDGWVLSTFRAGSDGSWRSETSGKGKEVKIDWVFFEFSKTDIENELLYLKGSIPGSKNTEILVKKSVKVINKMNINEKIESSSYSNPEYSIPGNLFLVNDWEERNPNPNCGILTLWIKHDECSTVSDNV